ncbi:MAG: hypothetical protein PHF67_01430 [Candidatus Nanoarchaeia archaeon]|nr:hypothetical protein [Candidatus Nanoarchaeia archaeon]
MANTLTKIIGAGLLGITGFLSGCATMDCGLKPADNLTVSEKKPVTVQGYAWERVTSDTVLGSGKIVGNGPSSETYLEARVGNDKFNVAGSTWSVFSLMDGKNSEQDYTFETRLKLSDSITVGVDPALWTTQTADVFVGKFPIIYNHDGTTAAFKPMVDLRNGGVLYVGSLGKTFPVEGTDVSITPRTCIGYADDFLGGNGLMHVTPGVSAHLGKIGAIDVLGDVNYQFGFNGRKDIVYGGINFEIRTGKVPLSGEKK